MIDLRNQDFTTTGKGGIGTPTPATKFQVAESITTSPRGMMSSQHNDGTEGARFHLRKSRGTNEIPLTVATGDMLGRLVSSGYDGASYLEMAGIDIVAVGTVGTNRLSTEMRFLTATDASPSVLTQRAVIDNKGRLGIGVASPTAFAHLPAGTATAGTAPLKLTSGVLNTTPEVGAIEFLTDAYYGTITTGTTRRMFVLSQTGRATAQTAANSSVHTFTLPATDGSYQIAANVLVTTSSAEAFTVTVAYTDEGNTARTATLNFQLPAGTIGTNIAFANGAVPYMGIPMNIRCKASTAITIATTGTFTGCTYNVEAFFKKLS